jgi:cyanate permease
MAEPSPSSRRYAIEAILFLSYAVFGVSWLAVAPLAVELIGVFHVSAAEFADLNTAVAIPKVFVPVVTGWAAVHVGLKKTILIALLLICAVTLGPLMPSFRVLLASRFVFGIGGAMLVTLMAPMVMQWFPKGELPIVNAFNGVAVNSGIAFTMYLTAPLSGTALGWRGALAAYGAVHVALFVAWALIGRENKVAPTTSAAALAPAAVKVRYLDVWKMKETWLVTLAFTGAVALYLSFSFWLPKFYQEQLHFSRATASQYSGIINLAGIPSAIVCGVLTKRLGVRRPFLIVGGLLSGVAAFGMFLLSAPVLIMASAVLLGIALFIPTAAIVTLLMELPGVTPRHVSLMMGTMFSVCYLIAGLAPKLVGLLRDITGSFVPGFVVLTVFSWVVFIAGFFLPETGPGRTATR